MNNIELIKLILPFLKPYARRLIFTLVLLPLGSFTLALQPMIIQKAIDGPLANLDLSGLWTYVGYFLIVLLVAFIIQVLQVYLINQVGQEVVSDIRKKLFIHLENLPMKFFDKTPVGRSVTRITSDIEMLSESFSGGLILVVIDIVNILTVMAFMLYLNFKLALLVIALLLPMIFISNYFQNEYRKANLDSRKYLSNLNSFLQQNIVGIYVVQVLNALEKNMKIFDEYNIKFFKASDKSIRADAQFSAIIEFVSIFTIAILILLSRNIILEEALSIGILIAFIQYTQSLFEPIRNMSERFIVIQSGFTAAERISQLLSEPLEQEPLDLEDLNALSFHKSNSVPIIEFKNVYFRYEVESKSPWVLKDLSFKIYSGDKVSITGKTGSGKSTIIKLLTKLYTAQEGEILINGLDIKKIPARLLRERISMIPQDSYIFGGDLKSNITLNRSDEKINLDIAKPFLEQIDFQLNSSLSARGTNISSGEEQVINFARAVVSNPDILILDEATAKIDFKTESALEKALFDFTGSEKTLIVIAHREESIKKMDRSIKLGYFGTSPN